MQENQPKFIVLDANVFIADYWLRSPSFVLLRDFIRKTKATLVIPKVVFEEVVNHRKEELEKVTSNIGTTLREASRLIRSFRGRAGWIASIRKKDIQDPYQKFLSSELAALEATIPDYSDIPHAEVVKRDLSRRKPFQQTGKGYRDTLLWETIIRNCVEKEALTLFVTQNIRDFSGSDEKLHADLQRDVFSKTGGHDNLLLSRDLLAFTDTYVVPYLRTRKDFAILVQNDKVSGLHLQKVTEDNLDALVEALDEVPSVMIGNPGIYEPQVDYIDVPPTFEVDQASELSQNLLLVVYEFLATVYFIYFLPHSEYYTMSDEESGGLAILDPEWNEYVMRVETEKNVIFRCRLTFNSETKEVESFEVEKVKSTDE